ncbi:MAG: phosphate ABC transporter permease PstA [Anaerolineae bacterium]|jgi:phosphate transport system permease protein
MAQSRDSVFYTEEGFEHNLPRRHRAAKGWQIALLASMVVAILALIALLLNIIDGAFGYVAVQNTVNPGDLVLGIQEEEMLAVANTQSSEDDDALARGVAGDPHAIGFFGYAYYQEHADDLRTLAVDGVIPSAGTVDSGEYGLSRPLFLYSTAQLMREKPEVASFLNYYLDKVNGEIDDVGYFPLGDLVLNASMLTWMNATGTDTEDAETVSWPVLSPQGLDGEVIAAGSSTVYPLSVRMAQRFEEAGYAGEITNESIGSTAGFRRFCVDGTADIANASRPITRQEIQLCDRIGRDPVEFRVGTDALAVVVSQENTFLSEVTTEQLQAIFTTAETWSDVDPNWPDEPIQRFIPGADSGTLDFFVEAVFTQDLAELPKETLVSILQGHVSEGLFRRFESEVPFAERSQEDVYQLVVERVVEPKIEDTWPFFASVLRRSEVLAEAAEKYPEAEIRFVSWIDPGFIRSPQSTDPEKAGVRTAILGSLWTILITVLFAFPLGVGAAIYLEEYAVDNRLNRLIQTNINNLAGVPSIIYGMLGLAVFVRALESLTSGKLFGVVDPTTANGRTILSAGLTLGLLILPLIIINAQEALKAVPNSLRQAGMGLGATKWQTIWHHVLPNAMPGVLTGTILAVSRAIGETAPLVVVGASTFITVDPTNPFSKFTTLPIQIYQWTSRPQDEFRNIAAAAILVLLFLLLTLNASAVLLRNRFSKRRYS